MAFGLKFECRGASMAGCSLCPTSYQRETAAPLFGQLSGLVDDRWPKTLFPAPAEVDSPHSAGQNPQQLLVSGVKCRPSQASRGDAGSAVEMALAAQLASLCWHEFEKVCVTPVRLLEV